MIKNDDINVAFVANYEPAKSWSATLVMVCIYLFLSIERPWESIRYLQAFPVERTFAIFMLLVAILHNKLKVVSSPTNKWVYGLLAMHFILAPFAYNTQFAIDQGVEYAKMVVLYLLMLAVVDDEDTLKLIIKFYVFTMIFYAVHSLWEFHNGRHVYRMGIVRMIGVDLRFNDPNAFGASVVLSIPFVYALLRNEVAPIVRTLYYCYFVLAVVCVVLTGSRSAFVALLLLMLLWSLMQQGKRKIIVLTSTLILFACVWNVMSVKYQDRIRTIWDKNAGTAGAHMSAEGRKIGWQASWQMFRQKPFTGVGGGGKNFVGYRMENGILSISDEGEAMALQAHVLYGEVLSEFGVFGALLFLGLVGTIFRCSITTRAGLLRLGQEGGFSYLLCGAIITSLLLLLFLGFAGHNFYRPLWLWLAAWAGCLIRIQDQTKTAQVEFG